jgi:ribosomal protein S18 acetylase RimI-like enzyme
MTGLQIRNAEVTDAQSLAQFAIMAGHGVMQLKYDGLLPGKSLINTIIERCIFPSESPANMKHWYVAVDSSGNILGGINCYSHDLRLAAPTDPLMDESRLQPLAELTLLEATAINSFYLSTIAVFPRYRGTGAGFSLMQEVERQALKAHLCSISLSTFENVPNLLRFYRRQGFKVCGSCPIGKHPAMEIDGNFVLMTRALEEQVQATSLE